MSKNKNRKVKPINLQPPPNLETFSMQDKKKNDGPPPPDNLDTRGAK